MRKFSTLYLETDDISLLELWDDEGFIVGFEGPPKILLQLRYLIQRCKVIKKSNVMDVFSKRLKSKEKSLTQRERQKKAARNFKKAKSEIFSEFAKWLMEVKGLSYNTAITYASRARRYLRLVEQGQHEKVKKSYFSSAVKYWEEFKERKREDLVSFFKRIRLEEKKMFDQILK